MELKLVNNKRNTIIKHILDGRLSEAFKLLPELSYASRSGELINELENLENTYKNILKYSFGYAKDPEREKIYINLKRKLIELTDDIVGVIYEQSDEWFASVKKGDSAFFRMEEKEKQALIDEMTVEKEFTTLLKGLEDQDTQHTEEELRYSGSLDKIFDLLWLTNNYHEGEHILAEKLFLSNHIPWHDKSLIVSAVFLSALRHFDSQKIEILFKVYDFDEPEVTHRALVSIFILTLVYESRFHLYPEILNRFKADVDPKGLSSKWEQIILQFIRAQETEKVTRKIQREIIPEVMKLRPEIEEKLKLDELINKDKEEEKNPDWQEFFSDTPEVYKKLEEFSMMQMDGSDVFMGAFSLLKRFGFFDKLSNWFLPFYKEHDEIRQSTQGVAENFNWNSFFEGIEEAPVMCNSDKYSFCFNIGFMPEVQKSMMLEFFNLELKQMKEVAEEENKHNQKSKDKVIYTQYIQDLYRFFKLHPKKNHFIDFFDTNLNVLNSYIAKVILTEDNVRHIGEFYFQKNYYEKALEIFQNLNNKKSSYELIEKIGFCFQKLGDYTKAIEYYKQAEILDSEKSWLHQKLGLCYTRIGEIDKAVEYYKQVEKDQPDNLEIQAYLGQLNIDKEDYETALKYYFKVEYLKPDLAKVQRPIGWCSFLLGKNEQALRYFKKLVEHEGERSDYLNLGHAYWVSGKLTETIESYRKAIKKSGNNLNWFSESFRKDQDALMKYGIDALDIALMIDYMLIDL